MNTQMISITKDFSEAPSGRYKTDGPSSGERFRDDILIPALQKNVNLEVNLDVTLGYGSSFLEEAFGGLIRAGFKLSDLRTKLKIVSKPAIYQERVWRYIEEASKRPQVT